MEPVTRCLALLNLGLKTAAATGLIKSRADLALENLDAKVSSLIAQPLHVGGRLGPSWSGATTTRDCYCNWLHEQEPKG